MLALDGGQRGDRMYLVHAPNVIKKTRLKLVISSINYSFRARNCQLFFSGIGAFDDFFEHGLAGLDHRNMINTFMVSAPL